jgi:hypothetical protein
MRFVFYFFCLSDDAFERTTLFGKIDLIFFFFPIHRIKITINTSKEEAKRRRDEEREERFRALVEENDFAMVSERAHELYIFLSLSLLHRAVFL